MSETPQQQGSKKEEILYVGIALLVIGSMLLTLVSEHIPPLFPIGLMTAAAVNIIVGLLRR